MSDLFEVIEDSISDAEAPADSTSPADTEPALDSDSPVESSPDGSDAPADPVADAPADAPTDEVLSPAGREKDDFEKKFGIPGVSSSGRENRLPYSRVKKIAEKAASDSAAAKVAEFQPRITEYETKIKDYEGRLQKVGEFEQVMVNNPDDFIAMLAELPAYKPFFDRVQAAFAGQTQPDTAGASAPVADDMPAPDQELGDGTMVYSMDGLKSLLKWQSEQSESRAVDRVTKQLEERYKPMESDWKEHQREQQLIPQVRAQMTEARSWPLFNEHEAEIVKALQLNQKLSLEGAYRQIVYPKLVADRGKMREEILREVRQAPRATSASTAASRPGASAVSSGPRSLEDVIAEAVKTLK